MEGKSNHTRILAVDPRPRRFGFAVLEGHHELLEWGVKNYRVSAEEIGTVVQKRIAPLFALFSPEIIVVRHVAQGEHSLQGLVTNVIKSEARRSAVKLVAVGKDELERLFGNGRSVNKHRIAGQVAMLFPELTWTLPPIRKTWMSEHHNMTIFDAISVGLAYFAQREDVFLTSPQTEARSPG